MSFAPNTVGDRILGAVLGEAIGDAFGHPNEFIAPGSRKLLKSLQEDNTFTDDTQLFCAVGEALLSTPPHENEEIFMDKLCANFAEWRVNPLGGDHRAPGNACTEGARRWGRAIPSESGGQFTWRNCGDDAAKGNGSAMRSGVIGAMYWNFPEYAFRIGCLSSIPTHNNLESILGSGLVAYLVAQSIKGVNWDIAVGDAIKTASDFDFSCPLWNQDPPLHKDIEIPCPQFGVLGTDFEKPNPWYLCGHLGAAYAYGKSPLDIKTFRKWNGDDNAVVPALAASVFFNTRFKSWLEVVVATTNFTTDCDTTGAIAGCIAGARFGGSSINPKWRKIIELSDHLHDLTNRIALASQTVEIKTEESYEVQL